MPIFLQTLNKSLLHEEINAVKKQSKTKLALSLTSTSSDGVVHCHVPMPSSFAVLGL